MAGVNTFPWAGLLRGQAVAADQVKQFTWAGSPQLSAAGASAGQGVFDIEDYGAVGDGSTDCTDAILAAMGAVPDDNGGTVWIPPNGIFKFSAPLPAKSGTTVAGGGTLLAAPIGQWAGTPYYGITNENNTASVITDTSITVRDITIDYTDFPSADGTRHCVYIRKARGVVVGNVTVIGGSSAIALPGCDNTLELGNRLSRFTNAGSDHWDSPSNARLIGCYIDATNAVQAVNWNAIPTSGSEAGSVANSFAMTGNTIVSTAAAGTPLQIEPLGTLGVTQNVTITGNTFNNTYIVMRGLVKGVAVCDNVFSGFLGTNSVIFCFARNGGTPEAIQISGNIIRDPLTSVGNLGVIRVETASGVIFDNIIMGAAYGCPAVYRGTTAAQIFGNYASAGNTTGELAAGFRIPAGTSSNSYIGWLDTGGSTPRVYLQASDNNWIWQSTDASGAARVTDTIVARSSTSEKIRQVPSLFSSTVRYSPTTGIAAAGTVIGTATALPSNYNEVATCTAASADGVKLSALVAFPQTVTNISADTLKVYPQNNAAAQIDGGGIGVAVTIAAGKSKTFFQYVTNDYRTIAST